MRCRGDAPARYRGYYYDNDIGLYYLQSRYYDPVTCKFINIDEPAILFETAASLQGTLLWDYCENNPVMNIDPEGYKMCLFADTETDKNLFLKELQKLTDHKLYISKGYVRIKSYSNRNRFKNGDKLIKEIINSYHECTVVIRNDGKYVSGFNRCDPDSDNATVFGQGCNAHVGFDLNSKYQFKTINPNTKVVSKQKNIAPICIVLAHELIHAHRFMRGRGIPDSKRSNYTYKTGIKKKCLGKNKYTYVYQTETKNERLEELATVGIKGVKAGDITENMIRKEHGLWLRGAY
ncbi:MAG: RHS repeat-associated core domain-containing protein [Oscillospiraceae bacterium]|nr:RHS repeat-associated core domain-containing protein [Oscillospiraceae bacterium]